jgi:NAD(P)-dependent dehydrogenase (short-subunit alcohol dehydrogenase family)
VLGKSTLPAREREIAILRIGWLCRSGYEWGQHVVMGKAAGLSDDEIARIPQGAAGNGWSDLERAVLRATDELYEDAFVSDATWAELASALSTQQLMDLVFTVGQYNLVSMALNSFGVQPEPALRQLPAAVSGRLAGKVAVVVGAGQTPGDTIGNGRATAVLFAREGARVVAVDRRLDSVEETVAMIRAEGGAAEALEVDATREADCARSSPSACSATAGSTCCTTTWASAAATRDPMHVSEEAWDRILAVNLKSVIFPCKHALPVLREQRGGAITNVSSIAAICVTPAVAYKTSKAGINAYTQTLASATRSTAIRANVIMPGLMETPMAIEGLSAELGIAEGEADRAAQRRRAARRPVGTAWDVAWAAVFLASDEARFITGVMLPVDGGQSARVG